MTPEDPRHGTDAGYQKHRRDGEPACGPCRTAKTEKMRAHRSNPVARIKSRNVSKAANRALSRLADAHRGEYERLYAEALSDLQRAPERRSA